MLNSWRYRDQAFWPS